MISRVFTSLSGAVVVTLLSALSVRPAAADTTVVPNAFAAAESPDGNGSPFNNGARTIQSIYDPTQLSALTPSSTLITGIALRLDRISGANPGQTAPAPSVPLTFSSFDIFLGQAALTAAQSDVSSTLDLNSSYVGGAAGRNLVRSGVLNIAANSYDGGPAGGPAPFGPVITFDTPYLYQGGGLVVELTHTGNGQIVFLVDAKAADGTGFASHSDFGYRTTNATFRAATPVTQFTFNAAVAAPEPGTLALLAMGGLMGATVIKRRRQA